MSKNIIMTEYTNSRYDELYPKTTKDQIVDLQKATESEAVEGVNNNAYMTPLTTAKVVQPLSDTISAIQNQNRYTKIHEWSFGTSMPIIDISNIIVWSNWNTVRFDIITTNGTQGNLFLYFSDGRKSDSLGKINSNDGKYKSLIFFPYFCSNMVGIAQYMSTFTTLGYSYEEIKSVVIDVNSINTRVTLWGENK